MKVLKVLPVLYFGIILSIVSCGPGAEVYPPTAVVAAFEAVYDATLGPVSVALLSHDMTGPISRPPANGLSYLGDLTVSDAGDGNLLRVYVLTITANYVSHSGYTISGTVDMTMNLTIDSDGYKIPGSLTLALDGNLTLSGGEIADITVTAVTVNTGTEIVTGTITFDGDQYPATDFDFL